MRNTTKVVVNLFSGSAQVENADDFVELKPWAVPCGTKLSSAFGMCFCLPAFGLRITRKTVCFPGFWL